MNYKEGVWIEVCQIIDGIPVSVDMHEKTIKAAEVSEQVFKTLFPDKAFVITSVFDGRHKAGSFHYKGQAFDQRSRELNQEEIGRYLIELRKALGNDFDVLFEIDHFHIEYDPKH
jgi:hypothetical protein